MKTKYFLRFLFKVIIINFFIFNMTHNKHNTKKSKYRIKKKINTISYYENLNYNL